MKVNTPDDVDCFPHRWQSENVHANSMKLDDSACSMCHTQLLFFIIFFFALLRCRFYHMCLVLLFSSPLDYNRVSFLFKRFVEPHRYGERSAEYIDRLEEIGLEHFIHNHLRLATVLTAWVRKWNSLNRQWSECSKSYLCTCDSFIVMRN